MTWQDWFDGQLEELLAPNLFLSQVSLSWNVQSKDSKAFFGRSFIQIVTHMLYPFDGKLVVLLRSNTVCVCGSVQQVRMNKILSTKITFVVRLRK